MNRVNLTNPQLQAVMQGLELLIGKFNTEAEESQSGLTATADQVLAEDLLDYLEERFGHLSTNRAAHS